MGSVKGGGDRLASASNSPGVQCPAGGPVDLVPANPDRPEPNTLKDAG